MQTNSYDIVIIGSGPAGQKAAIQGAKAGQRVLLIERDRRVGGACVHYGTIPSKTLRQSALLLQQFKRQYADIVSVRLRPDLEVTSLMSRLDQVVRAHEHYMAEQLARNGITQWHGRARFITPQEIEVLAVDGTSRRVIGKIIVIATGSQPRTPAHVPIDHEHILDSDSILSMLYLPTSLTVLGAGVIASEYASIFASIGVHVTMIDRGNRPLSFLDPELTACFVRSFEASGSRFLGQQEVASVEWDGVDAVVTTLRSGTVIRNEKLLCALGRQPMLDDLNLPVTGVELNERGFIAVDAHCQTNVPHIYAAGDVIGPPSLAACSMEQGRRAIRHALGLETGDQSVLMPVGIYTIPEMASIGLTEAEARQRYGSVVVGRASFAELTHGQIAGITEGLLKLVADPHGRQLLGVQIVGEGATELVHVGEISLLTGGEVDTFVDHVFNFPTLAEAYRVAALDIVKQRTGLPGAGHGPTLDGSVNGHLALSPR